MNQCDYLVVQGVIERDRLVFTEVRKNRRKPIFMLTSGGYQVYILRAPYSYSITIYTTIIQCMHTHLMCYNRQGETFMFDCF